MTSEDRSGNRLQEMDPTHCRQLLAAVSFGRLAVVDQDRPAIVVLNYVLDGEDIVFRTSGDTRLARLTRDGQSVPAAFEVDSAFPPTRSGWSVIASGELRQETDPARADKARSRLRTWAVGERDTVLRLEVGELTGRQVGASG